MSGQTNLSISASTFQNGSQYYPQRYFGENFTTAGLSISNDKIKHWSLYAGFSRTVEEPEVTEDDVRDGRLEDPYNMFKEPSYRFVGDVKCSYPFKSFQMDNGRDITLSFKGRARTDIGSKDGELNGKTALRGAVQLNVPIGEKSNIYFDPYLLTKVNYNELSSQNILDMLKENLVVGMFAGVERDFQIGEQPFTVFVEGQLYDIGQNVNDAIEKKPMDWSTASVNVGVTIPLNFNKK